MEELSNNEIVYLIVIESYKEIVSFDRRQLNSLSFMYLMIYATVMEDFCGVPLKRDDSFEYSNLILIYPWIKICIQKGTYKERHTKMQKILALEDSVSLFEKRKST